MNIAEGDGAIAFMQKSHDHGLRDPIASEFDGYVIQVREPISRAVSNYELNLRTLGFNHSRSYQRFWLGMEAYYVVHFIKKWCRPSARTLILKYEQLVEDPVAYFESFFRHFGLPLEMIDAELIGKTQDVFAGSKRIFSKRNAEKSEYYDRELFTEFGEILRCASMALGYDVRPMPAGEHAPNSIQPLFVTQERRANGDVEGALTALDSYLADPEAHLFGRLWRGEMLASIGRDREAVAEFQEVIQAIPSDPRAYIPLAKFALSHGDPPQARKVIASCLDAAQDKRGAALLIIDHFGDGDLTASAYRHLGPQLSREEVITAFKFILGRKPETEDVIASHRNIVSLEKLREVLLSSNEFSKIYESLMQRRFV
jgi:hypothetical protein